MFQKNRYSNGECECCERDVAEFVHFCYFPRLLDFVRIIIILFRRKLCFQKVPKGLEEFHVPASLRVPEAPRGDYLC